MKIVEQTSTKLVLRDSHWANSTLGAIIVVPFSFLVFFLGLIIFGELNSDALPTFLGMVVFWLVGILYYLIFLSESINCTFDKSLGSMILKRQKMFKTKIIERPIKAILGVRLEEITDLDDYTTSRVCLVFASDRLIPLTSDYNDTSICDQTTKDMATFLNVANHGTKDTKMPDAIAHWKEVIRLNPNDADAYRNLGMALYRPNNVMYQQKNKRYKKEALASLKQSIKLLKAQGDDEEASRCLKLYWTIYWDFFSHRKSWHGM